MLGPLHSMQLAVENLGPGPLGSTALPKSQSSQHFLGAVRFPADLGSLCAKVFPHQAAQRIEILKLSLSGDTDSATIKAWEGTWKLIQA